MAHSNPADVVQRHWAAWAQEDLATSMALFTSDAVFALYVPEHVLPFGGESQGKAGLSDRGKMIFAQFAVVYYRGQVNGVSGDVVRGTIAYCFRHRATGEEIEGTMRHRIELRDGLIARIDEYHDAAKVAAFMRLISFTA